MTQSSAEIRPRGITTHDLNDVIRDLYLRDEPLHGVATFRFKRQAFTNPAGKTNLLVWEISGLFPCVGFAIIAGVITLRRRRSRPKA
jgi:hypothetical protein